MNRTCRKICKILDKAIGILEREGNEYTTCDIARVYETLTGKVGFYSYFRERIRVLFDTGHEGTAKAYEATLHSMQNICVRLIFHLHIFLPALSLSIVTLSWRPVWARIR